MIMKIMRASVLLAALLLAACTHRSKELSLYIGTYGQNYYRVGFSGGKFTAAPSPVPAKDPSYLATGAPGVLYAVSETGPDSGIYSFADGVKTAYRSEIGDDPCFLTVLPGRPYVVTADYSGGSVSVFRLDAAGAITERVEVHQYSGSGPVLSRQRSAHIHQVKVIPGTDWLLASDLGSDCIRVLHINPEGSPEVLTDHPELTVPCGPGSGPRHYEFNTAAGLLYLLTEISGEVLVFRLSTAGGVPSFSLLARLQADETGIDGSADIHLHPSGRFLYTSHRLRNDGISIFAVDPDGMPRKIGYTPTESHPRNFYLTPDGKYMLVACRDSGNIQVFSIDEKSGGLTPLPESTLHFDSDKPVCIISL